MFGMLNLADLLRRAPEQFADGNLVFWSGFGRGSAADRSLVMRMAMLHMISTTNLSLGGLRAADGAAGGGVAGGGVAGGGGSGVAGGGGGSDDDDDDDDDDDL
jgi:hypothetical protein